MNKITIERIAVFVLAAFLVGMFIYQVAYGMESSGTMLQLPLPKWNAKENFFNQTETSPSIGDNQIYSLPGETARFNAGYAQGFIGLSLKGHHTEQFLLGYINGTKAMQNAMAVVAGYLHMPFHGSNQSMTYYKEGKWNRGYVDCKALEPIGTLPVHTNDHYMQFWIGYQDGSILRDNSDPSGNFPHFGDCPSGNSAEFCAGWKFGWNMEEAEINPPSPSKCPENGI